VGRFARRPVRRAGEHWTTESAAPPRRERLWEGMFGLGVLVLGLVPILAAIPALLLILVLGGSGPLLLGGPGLC
jgi:hypothetical protein